MEAEAQTQSETTPEETAKYVKRDELSQDQLNEVQDFMAALAAGAKKQMAVEGCLCDKPECPAKAFHKLESLPEEFKPHWETVKKQLEQQIDSVMKEHSKTRKLAAKLDHKLQRKHVDLTTLQSQLDQAQKVNLKLIKTVGRLAKK